MRKYGRTDANHTETVEAFRKLGCSVVSLAALGKGCPDLAVGYGGLTALVEVKNPKRPKAAQNLTPDQETFWDTWKGGVRLVDGLAAVEETVKYLHELRDAMVEYRMRRMK